MISHLSELKSVDEYLRRIGAEGRTIRSAVIKEQVGRYWTDVAVIRFNKDGIINCPAAYAPTESEQARIKDEFAAAPWPEYVMPKTVRNLPHILKEADPENIFEFRNEDGDIVMLQLRGESGKGKYRPFTYWSDNQWRMLEPDGELPLWGLDQLGKHEVVFLHEGAKAARHVRRMVEAASPDMKRLLAQHPWGDELMHAAHLGWIGGALNPHRTDWSPLKRAGVKKVFIVSDNDPEGLSAVPKISFRLHCIAFHVQFTSEWPISFDLADPFPDSMFKTIGEDRFYVGPSFRSCVHPATWATDQIPSPNPKATKPIVVLREAFKAMWAYAEEQDMYVCRDMPDIVRTEAVLNKMISAFSHVNNTTSILQREYRGRSTRLCYRPDVPGRIVTERNSSAINLHTPSHIKSRRGDITPFTDFMTYLLPSAAEREIVLDWCATLIAHPEIKMDFGLLMVSESQGVGKTTLGSNILAPLVGPQNVSHPSEQMITNSDFNEWLAHKRLIVVNEIYSGHSWKAYNKLKSIITDQTIDVNRKFMPMYTIDNWSHMYACSNSMRALKMESDDRRWFYPIITEQPWKRDKFQALHEWLFSGGLSIIRNWAEMRKTWIKRGQHAPMTERKQELIDGSRTEGQIEAARLAEAMNDAERPIAIAMKDVVAWVRSQVQGKVYETDLELRKAMKDNGCIIIAKRVKVFGLLQYAIVNKHRFWEEILANGSNIDVEVRAKIAKPEDLMEGSI